MRAQDRQSGSSGSGSNRSGAAHTGRTASSPASDSARQAAAGEAERLTPEAAAVLQRAVGNAAFSAVIAGGEQHQHGAGCGHTAPPTVQRSPVEDVLRTPGRPLDEAVRTDMETRLGADFSDVRVHTDNSAHESADSVNAHAYTSGSHIVFQRGRYDTSSSAGRHMLAHELTHVIQQRNGPVAGTDRGDGTKVSDPSDRFEREAEAIASRAVSGPPVQRQGDSERQGTRPSAGPAVQRMAPSTASAPTAAPTFKLGQSNTRSRGIPISECNEEGQLERVMQHLEALHDGGLHDCTVELNGHTREDALAIATDRLNVLTNRPTNSFNVRYRAADVRGGVVFTDNHDVQKLAARHGLHAWGMDVRAQLFPARPKAQAQEEPFLANLRQMFQDGGWSQLFEDENLTYYGPPAPMRGPRPHPAAPSGKALPPPPDTPVIASRVVMTGPCIKGSRTPSQSAAMGGHSALNYAKAVGVPSADTTTWEWLHLVGSALGGANQRGNLVAGTYDSNTQMTMMENRIAKYCEANVTADNPAELVARAELYQGNSGNTWVAERIRLVLTHGSTPVMEGEFGATISNVVDRMEYDYYDYLFGIQSGTEQNYSDRLFSPR